LHGIDTFKVKPPKSLNWKRDMVLTPHDPTTGVRANLRTGDRRY